jgi:hypothetical protein
VSNGPYVSVREAMSLQPHRFHACACRNLCHQHCLEVAINMAQQEGGQIELLEALAEDLATRPSILISEML